MNSLLRSPRVLQGCPRLILVPSCSTSRQVGGVRFSHKLVEVELQQDCLGLGVRGDRVPVAPGRARELFGSARVLYVVKGRAVSPLRDLLRKYNKQEMAREERVRIERERLLKANPALASAETPAEVDPHEAARKADIDLQTALGLVPTPLIFHRRLIHASPPPLPGQPAVSSEIFGSVSVLDVVASLREFGVVVEEAAGSFAEAEGVEKARLKATGRFEFLVQLRALGQVVPVQVEVVREA